MTTPKDGVTAAGPTLLSNEEIHALFYPMGTATENQLLIARAIGRAVERKVMERNAGVKVLQEGQQ